MKQLLRNSFLLMIGFSSAACVTIPETGGNVLLLTSSSQENQLGEQGYREVLAKSKLSGDQRLVGVLKRVGQKIAAQAGRNDFKWEFNLIESKEQNAWCMPGGKVAFYTGILPALQNEAGMAVVMGHEVAHATLRHSGQRMSQTMLVNLGLSVADLTLSNQKHHDTLMGLLGAGATVGLILPYSRDHESEADAIGLRYAAKAGYDPQEAVSFWQRFGRASGGAPPEFLSTHPATATRINNLKRLLPEARVHYEQSAQKLGQGERL